MELNPIHEMSSGFLDQFENLLLLNLSATGIKMSPMMFANAKKLRELSLRNNPMKQLDAEWFEGLSELKELDVEDNLIEGFDYVDLLKKLPSLEMLKLDENNFNCSFVHEMIETLEKMDRLDVLDVPYEERLKEKKDSKVFGIFCYDQTNGGRGNWSPIIGVVVVVTAIFASWIF